MKKVLAIVLTCILSICVVFGHVSQAETEDSNQLIVGVSTKAYGDWAHGAVWTGDNEADILIRSLINDYSTVSFDENGVMHINESVAESIETKEGEDGSKTYTVKIHEDLLFNDGSPIEAKHFLASLALFNHESLLTLGSQSYGYDYYVGGNKYAGIELTESEAGEGEEADEDEPADEVEEGETEEAAESGKKIWSGVRLIDAHTFELTLMPSYNPYFYDMSLVSLSPLSISMWLGEGYDLKDDGEGVYWEGDMSVDALTEKIEHARFLTEDRVSAGPYSLVSMNETTGKVVLKMNEHYKGDFRGQKPQIETLVFEQVENEEKIDALLSGRVDLVSHLTGGAEIHAALELVEDGGFSTVEFARPGYGKLLFQADFGPTQFKAVRQSLAHLIDRETFVKEFTSEFGTVPAGPFAEALWQYKAVEDNLQEGLKAYAYSVEEATKLLIEDGWTLNSEGGEWESGLRYKEVTEAEAGYFEHNIVLEDERVLMPLIIEWASAEGNAAATLLQSMFEEKSDLNDVGMEIRQQSMPFAELLHWLYRDGDVNEAYGAPKYGMYNLSSDIHPIYDHSYEWTFQDEIIEMGYNANRLFDEELDKLSMDMVYEVSHEDVDNYLKLWTDYVLRWNELLPDLPLYANSYYTVFNDKLKGYEESTYWGFERAILSASIEP